MNYQDDSNLPTFSQEEETNSPDIVASNGQAVDDTEDTDPPLDEEDLEENDLTVEEADQIVWDPPKSGSSGTEEKDSTD
jgi:hypothetical protein